MDDREWYPATNFTSLFEEAETKVHRDTFEIPPTTIRDVFMEDVTANALEEEINEE